MADWPDFLLALPAMQAELARAMSTGPDIAILPSDRLHIPNYRETTA
jgi:hypothetical protein